MHRIIYFIAAILLTIISFSCRGTQEHPGIISQTGRDRTATSVTELLMEDSVSRWIPSSLEMPDDCVPLKVNHIGRYPEVFNDSNHVHWAEAEIVGISPLTDTRSHWHLDKPLVKIVSCADYYVEDLNYSAPYLVPEAADMLHEIGSRFHRTVKERSGADYRVKVTSVLRTPSSVKRLRRVNVNSVDSSVHTLATTIDISYARYICDNPAVAHRAEDLKGVLAEVLYQMQQEGRCYVKYEMKQPCFHISCRNYKK